MKHLVLDPVKNSKSNTALTHQLHPDTITVLENVENTKSNRSTVYYCNRGTVYYCGQMRWHGIAGLLEFYILSLFVLWVLHLATVTSELLSHRTALALVSLLTCKKLFQVVRVRDECQRINLKVDKHNMLKLKLNILAFPLGKYYQNSVYKKLATHTPKRGCPVKWISGMVIVSKMQKPPDMRTGYDHPPALLLYVKNASQITF